MVQTMQTSPRNLQKVHFKYLSSFFKFDIIVIVYSDPLFREIEIYDLQSEYHILR